MHETVRQWIVDVLNGRPELLSIALRQRAKFEGWLKFELAAHAVKSGAENVVVERPLPGGDRSDVSFDWNGLSYDVELKTPNTNWRMPGVPNLTRPITKNLQSIVDDAGKAVAHGRRPLVAFVLFPVPCADSRWFGFLERIGKKLDMSLSHEVHATQITLEISDLHRADVVVCCFPVSAEAPV
jgi:hypothetical protein